MPPKSSMYNGQMYKTNSFGDVLVENYVDCENVYVKFLNTDHVATFTAGSIRKGRIRDITAPHVQGKGFTGMGKYSAKRDKEADSAWKHMLARCYSGKYKGYEDCEVCAEWYNFQVFCEWHYKNFQKGFALDKDLLVIGNREYSPETCEYVPQSLNNLIVSSKKSKYKKGVSLHGRKYRSTISIKGTMVILGSFNTEKEAFLKYKEYKEDYVKETASYHFERGEISKRLYLSLIAFEVGDE